MCATSRMTKTQEHLLKIATIKDQQLLFLAITIYYNTAIWPAVTPTKMDDIKGD